MRKILSLILLSIVGLSPLIASNAYILAPGSFILRPTTSVQWATDFWFDDNEATLPGHLTQTTVSLDLEYGIAPDLAADLSIGYSNVNYQGGPLGGTLVLTKNNKNVRRGTTDTRLGLSWRVVDEFQSLSDATPTITLRLGAIIAGNYETGFLNAVSDGADGVEAGFKFGKVFLGSSAGIYGDVAYRWLSSSPPDEWEASLGVYKTWGYFTYSLGMREKQSTGGLDILGPGFTLNRFPDLREKNRTVEIGLTWNWRTESSLSLGYARTLKGENTPKKSVVVTALSMQL